VLNLAVQDLLNNIRASDLKKRKRHKDEDGSKDSNGLEEDSDFEEPSILKKVKRENWLTVMSPFSVLF
jgi:hypothetical protein